MIDYLDRKKGGKKKEKKRATFRKRSPLVLPRLTEVFTWRINLLVKSRLMEKLSFSKKKHKMWGLGREKTQDVVFGWGINDWLIIFYGLQLAAKKSVCSEGQQIQWTSKYFLLIIF
jgi:hypothetical protein|tara:strand:+ start:48 stop:395 length:348 start_codon:yes stop_codon:yes gene_type:complete